MPKLNRIIRQSQAVVSYGVGSIYDVLGESFVLCDTTWWTSTRYNAQGRRIRASRLVRALSQGGRGVNALYEPVEMEDAKQAFNKPPHRGLPYLRFPRWLFCSSCRKMFFWNRKREADQDGDKPTCLDCGDRHKLAPMRFIVICEDGHMGEVPWQRWAHSNPENPEQRTCKSESLRFLSRTGYGGGFDSLLIRCDRCGAARSLRGITGKNALAGVGWSCPGKQPWQMSTDREDCDRDTHVVQRGAGSVYYPSSASAITIPPESDRGGDDLLQRIRQSKFYDFWDPDDEALREPIASKIAGNLGVSPEKIMAALDEEASSSPETEEDIATQEWNALTQPHTPPSSSDAQFINERVDFIAESSPSPTVSALGDLIDQVMAVRKLREVRALLGFYRHKPGGPGQGENRLTPPDLGKGQEWLPATEVFGEGVFLTLDEERLQRWERDESVVARSERLEKRREESIYGGVVPSATPRYVLLHTLAHLLIRRLAFSCGYASAALRERIYAQSTSSGDPRAGILIYTAEGDSEGTLGGLVRRAEPPRLASDLISALYDARGCSSDPVCFESNGQGVEALNLAACHACTLAAETSCESMNLLLDRVLLIGDNTVPGFFSTPLEHAVSESVGSGPAVGA
jgi:hypothetical protein